MNKPTLREYLDAVREECNAATEGPWKYTWTTERDGGVLLKYRRIEGADLGSNYPSSTARGKQNDANHRFIAHSRTNVEVLLNMVEAIYDEAVYPTRAFRELEPGEFLDVVALRKQLEDLVPEGEE